MSADREYHAERMNTLRDFCVNMAANIVHDFLKPLVIWLACKILWPYRTVLYARCIVCFKFCRHTLVRALTFYRALARLIALRAVRLKPVPAWITGQSFSTSTSFGAMTNTTITPRTGALVINAPAEPLPPGTASAIVMAMQPPINRSPFQPAFVNNSMMAQWETVAHQHDIAARIAMGATMPGFR